MTTTPFAAYEVAYRIPGKAWRRRTITSPSSEARFYAMAEDEAAEIRWADVDSD